MIAIAFSVLAHAALLAVHFAAPEAFRMQPTDPGLEVILVNAKHDKAPLKADALAQANLDGGGNADAGRAKSPLPDLRKIETATASRPCSAASPISNSSKRTC
jgi:protein TonB